MAHAVDPHAFALDLDAYRAADHSWIAELDSLTVHAGEPHQRMGTRAVDESMWLVVDELRDRELALRNRLLDEARREVFATLPGSEAACAEVAAAVVPTAGSLLDAGRLVQEDLCVMQRDHEAWKLTAAVLCFPTYWRLADKIGRTLDGLHEPVPHYATDLSDRMNRFFDRLAPGRIVVRRNWGFSAHPLLFVPDLSALSAPAEYRPDLLWLRSERQTLKRFPTSDAILFTIKVQLAPAMALLDYPGVAARLLDAMTGWSPELVASRGGRHGWVPDVKTWLATIV